MSAKTRPPLPSIADAARQDGQDEDAAALARLGAKHGLLSTARKEVAPVAAPDYPRPAPTIPLQLKIPEYVKDDLEKRRVQLGLNSLKEVVLLALQKDGFQIEPIDLRDLRYR